MVNRRAAMRRAAVMAAAVAMTANSAPLESSDRPAAGPGAPHAAFQWLPGPVADGLAGRPVLAAPRLDSGPLAPNGWFLVDGFESLTWPDTDYWSPATTAPPTWWPSSCRSRTGARSLWAFGGPTGRGEVPCTSPTPPGSVSRILMQLDLTGARLATRLELVFEAWLGFTEGSGSGLFVHLLVPDGSGRRPVPVFGATGIAGRWAYPARQLDLMNLVDINSPADVYDLRGGRHLLEWTAIASEGAPAAGGVFIDDMSLVWEPDPAVSTPTPWPTSTPSATATATRPSTATPTPTELPATPEGRYLPLLFQSFALREPTPTPTETATPAPPTEEPSTRP